MDGVKPPVESVANCIGTDRTGICAGTVADKYDYCFCNFIKNYCT